MAVERKAEQSADDLHQFGAYTDQLGIGPNCSLAESISEPPTGLPWALLAFTPGITWDVDLQVTCLDGTIDVSMTELM